MSTATARSNRPEPKNGVPISDRGTIGRNERRGRRKLTPPGLPWILPALALSVGLLYYCIGYTGYISTLNWNGTDPNPQSVGLGNYVQAFQDPVLYKTLENTVLFFVFTFLVQTTLGFVLAAMLHSKPRFGSLYKVVIFTPVVIAPAIMAPVFRQMYSATGQVNSVLDAIGLGFLSQPWLAQESTALPVLMSITIWEFTGLTFILYFAAMSQVDPEMLEAARIDGASNFRVLRSMVWPSVRGTTIALGMLSIIGALKTFDIPYLVTIGGPNYATEFLGTFIYRETIPLSNVGYGAALSVLLLLLALLFAIVLQVRTRERDVAA